MGLLERPEVGYGHVLSRWRAGEPLERAPRPERTLVFVGDLVDRGPDSPSVVDLTLALTDVKLAVCLIGNHELNLLRGDNDERFRPGTGWFSGRSDGFLLQEGGKRWTFGSREATAEQRARFRERLDVLPLAAEREDLRVVHACWDPRGIQRLRDACELGIRTVRAAYEHFASLMAADAEYAALVRRGAQEIAPFEAHLRDESVQPPPAERVPNWLLAEARAQNDNPVKILTSGPEEETPGKPLFKERWRLLQRRLWWNTYGEIPVVVGHYWRSTTLQRRGLWDGVDPYAWLGETGRVFCVDYSVGRCYRDRIEPHPDPPADDLGLAALLWPDASTAREPGWCGPELVFADGAQPTRRTTDFGGYEGVG